MSTTPSGTSDAGPSPSPWYCYILRNTLPGYEHLTYNGSTNNPVRRLRQHNQEIVGGAAYTKQAPGGWEMYCLLTGFPDHKNALSCEWRIKHSGGKPRQQRPRHHRGPLGRIRSLNDILVLERWTAACVHANCDHVFTLYLADDVISYVDWGRLPAHVVFGGSVAAALTPMPTPTTTCQGREGIENQIGF